MGKDLKGKELGVGLSQRKDGVYQGRYKDRFNKIKYIYGTKLSEVKKELAVAIAENIQFTSIRDDIKLDDWFNRWIEVYKKKSVRPNTLREYTHIYNKNISPFLGNRNINSFVKSDIQTLIDKIADDNYKYERQNKIKVILNDMFSRAIDLYNVAVNTGLRPGELFALTPNDIHLDEGYIDVNKTLVYQKYLDDKCKTFHIEPPKTKQSYRQVPINSECIKYLEKQFELKDIVKCKRPKEQNNYLFVTSYNTPLNSQIYSDSIKAIVKQINLARSFDNEFPVFSGHTLRHTFATRCFEAGVQAKVVQSYLGHATLKMTMDLYTHVTEERAAVDIERIVKDKDNIVDFKKSAV